MPNSDGYIDSSNLCSQAVVERILGDYAVTSIKIYNTLESDNFSAGSAGWQINRATGSAEFQDATIRGSLNASDITAGTLDASGITVTNLSASSINTGTLDASLITVSNLSASSINTGTMAVTYLTGGTYGNSDITFSSGSDLISSNYSVGSAGWKINGAGDAEFNNITVRGTIYATAGEIGGLDIDGSLTMVAGAVIRSGGASADRVQIGYTDGDPTIAFYDGTSLEGQLYLDPDAPGIMWLESENGASLNLRSATDMFLFTEGGDLYLGGSGTAYYDYIHVDQTNNQVRIYTGSASSTLAATFSNGQIRAEDGSAGSPSVTYANDTDSGAFSAAANQIAWATAGTEAARIDTSQNFMVGKTSIGSANVGFEARPGGIVQATISSGSDILNLRNNTLATSERFIGFLDSSGGRIGSVSANGTTAVLYNTTSDERLKTNWQPLTGALERLMTLEPAEFDMGGVHMHGLGAQRTQPVMPHMVTHNPDDDWWGIDYSQAVPDLIAAIQEVATRLNALEKTNV